MEDCYQFIMQVAIAFQSRTIPDDPRIMSFINYSGTKWNDQGDISACLNDPTMNFVEVEMRQSWLGVFRGICLPAYCNAQWLNNNKEDLIELAKNFNITGINKNNIILTQYPLVDAISFTSTTFILMTALFTLFFLLIIISCFTSQQTNKKQLKKTTTPQHPQSQVPISRKLLEQASIENEQDKCDIENKRKEENKKQNKKQPMIIQIINCWNVKDNYKKLVTLNLSNQDLLAFNCIRVISFLQVILGHEFLIRAQYMSNLIDLNIVQAQTFSLFIYSTLFSVDVFFLLGGFFVSYVSADPKNLSLFSIKKQVRAITTFFAAIINRIFRILPSYLIALIFFWKYSYFFGNSPTWYKFIDYAKQCDDIWWKRVLFIDNFFEGGLTCFGWGWYLSNDMQMFIFSLLLIIIYANNKIYGKISITITLLAVQSVGIYTSISHNYLITTTLATLPQEEYQVKPWNRAPPYFIGLLFGILYKEYVQEKSNEYKFSIISKIQKILQQSWIMKWVFYSVGLAIIFFITFAPRPLQVNGQDYWNEGFQNIWFGTCRSFYVFGVMLVLLPGMCGSNDLVMKVMSSKIFQFLSKLTFQGYLIHYILLTFSQWNFKDSLYLSTQNILELFLSELTLTLFFSFIFVILIESPFNNLANIIFSRKKENKSEQKQVVKEEQHIQQKIPKIN